MILLDPIRVFFLLASFCLVPVFGSFEFAAIFCSTSIDHSNAEFVVQQALASINASLNLPRSLIWFDGGFGFTNTSLSSSSSSSSSSQASVGDSLTPLSATLFFNRLVLANVSVILTTSCSTSSRPASWMKVASIFNWTRPPPTIISAGVCSSWQQQVVGNFPSSPSVLLSRFKRIHLNHAVEAHVQSFADVVNQYGWNYIGLLINADEFDPDILLPSLKAHLSKTKLVLPVLNDFELTRVGIKEPATKYSLSYFQSNVSAPLLRAYAHSIRSQHVRIVCVFASLDAVPALIWALDAEYLTGIGVGLLFSESLLSSALSQASSALPNSLLSNDVNSSFYPTSSSYFALQGAMIIRPATTINSVAQSQFSASSSLASVVAQYPSAIFLFDAVRLMSQQSSLDVFDNLNGFMGASGFVSFTSSSTSSPSVMNQLFGRKWSGGAQLFNIQGNDLVMVGVVENGEVRFVRPVLWPGNQAQAPAAQVIRLPIVYQAGILESEVGVLGALMAADLINWASLRPQSNQKASCMQSQNRYYNYNSSITQKSVLVPAAIQALLPLVPRGTIVQVPTQWILNDNCTASGTLVAASVLKNISNQVIAAIGPFCSTAALTILTPTVQTNGEFITPINSTLPFISYSVGSSLFRSQATFPTFARILPSQSAAYHSVMSLFANLGIRRIGVVYVNDAYGQSGTNDLMDSAVLFDVAVVTRVSVNKLDAVSVVRDTISVFKDKKLTTIVCVSQGFAFSKVMQALYDVGLYGSGHLLVGVPSSYDNDLESVIQSSVQVQQVAQNLIIMYRTMDTRFALTSAFRDMFLQLFPRYGETKIFPFSQYSGFDAVVLALASYISLLSKSPTLAANTSSWSSTELQTQLLAETRNLKPLGVSGPLLYPTPGSTDRFGMRVLYQIRRIELSSMNGSNSVSLVTFDTADEFSNLNQNTSLLLGQSLSLSPNCPPGFSSFSSQSSQTCVPCPPETFKLDTDSACQPCIASQFCPLATFYQLSVAAASTSTSHSASPLSSVNSIASAASFDPSPADSVSLPPTNIFPVQSGNLVSNATMQNLQFGYLYAFIVVLTILIAFGVVLWQKTFGFVNEKADLIIECDLLFTRSHPTALNQPVMRRQTLAGGYFTICFGCLLVLGLAFFTHRWLLDQFKITQIYQPFLAIQDERASDFYIRAQFIGVDNPASCELACASYVQTASVPTDGSVTHDAHLSSPWSSRSLCNESTPLADAQRLQCGASSMTLGSRVFLWSEGVLGSFQCQFQALPSSTCSIRFQPPASAVFSRDFAVHITLPATRASAILWSVRSKRFNGFDIGSKGSLFRPGHLLFGPAPTELKLALIPFIWNGDVANEPSLPNSDVGYLSQLLNVTFGSTVDQNSAAMQDPFRMDSITNKALPTDVPFNATSISFEFSKPMSGYTIQLESVWSSIGQASVSLFTQISALLLSFLFSTVQHLLVFVESHYHRCYCIRSSDKNQEGDDSNNAGLSQKDSISTIDMTSLGIVEMANHVNNH